MRDVLAEALKDRRADYIEIHVEEREATRLSFRGRELEEISTTSDLGGNVRALVKGGWGFASFNDISTLREKVELAVEHARAVGHEKSKLAPIAPVVDVIHLAIKKDPRLVPLTEKKHLLDSYAQLCSSVSPKIQTTRSNYGETFRKLYLANTTGSYIEEERLDITTSVAALAREGDNVQQGHVSAGSADDYGAVEHLHDQVEQAARRAVSLLSTKPVKGGEYTVVLDQKLAGVFAHEAFGHLSEADHVYENPELREVLVLGKRFGGPILNIVDGAAIDRPGLRGSYKYDSEGTPAQKTYLIKEGILVGRLHSRETAATMNEKPTGNARAINYRFPPIVRMTNTFIEPGKVTFDEMIADIEEGVYAKGSFGGETGIEMFTFSAEEGHMIRNGKIAEPARGVLLSGNVFETLQNIDAIGDDIRWHNGGGCGKGGQSPLPVSMGSPHIRIRKCVVGGR
ncbi:MAG: TldD/PmbA family protein [Chloroflexi bacterium]|nr:TldD/PmbA family protein [Chloroflexota bacterium]MDA8186583.1 TldD/PmbA family protein [Dehalococcoidales bacterium]